MLSTHETLICSADITLRMYMAELIVFVNLIKTLTNFQWAIIPSRSCYAYIRQWAVLPLVQVRDWHRPVANIGPVLSKCQLDPEEQIFSEINATKSLIWGKCLWDCVWTQLKSNTAEFVCLPSNCREAALSPWSVFLIVFSIIACLCLSWQDDLWQKLTHVNVMTLNTHRQMPIQWWTDPTSICFCWHRQNFVDCSRAVFNDSNEES